MKNVFEKDNNIRVADFNWAFKLNRLAWRAMGIWPNEEDNIYYRLWAFVLMNICIFWFFIPQAYALVLVIHDLEAVMNNLLINSATVAVCCKFFILRMKRKDIEMLINVTLNDWNESKPKWVYEIMKNQAYNGRIITIIGLTFLTMMYLGFIIGTALNVNARMINNITDYGDRYLLAQSYYPFDYSPSPIFELVNSSQAISALITGTMVFVPDNYFTALIYHLSGQLQILATNFQNHNFSSKINVSSNRLGVLINKHTRLIWMSSKINNIFSWVIMSQLLCLCISSITAGYNLMIIINRDQKIHIIPILTLFCTLLGLIIFAFFACFACETLHTNSLEVAKKIYDSSWSIEPNKNHRNIILIIMYAQKWKPVIAGKLFPLSLKFFCSILYTIGCYISVLLTVLNPQ